MASLTNGAPDWFTQINLKLAEYSWAKIHQMLLDVEVSQQWHHLITPVQWPIPTAMAWSIIIYIQWNVHSCFYVIWPTLFCLFVCFSCFTAIFFLTTKIKTGHKSKKLLIMADFVIFFLMEVVHALYVPLLMLPLTGSEEFTWSEPTIVLRG